MLQICFNLHLLILKLLLLYPVTQFCTHQLICLYVCMSRPPSFIKKCFLNNTGNDNVMLQICFNLHSMVLKLLLLCPVTQFCTHQLICVYVCMSMPPRFFKKCFLNNTGNDNVMLQICFHQHSLILKLLMLYSIITLLSPLILFL